MAKITIDVSGDINSVKLDKNRYFLKIKNTDSPVLVRDAIATILKNNLFYEVTCNSEEHSNYFSHDYKKLYGSKNSNTGFKFFSFRLKDAWKWREMTIGHIHLHQGRVWNKTLGNRFNTDLIINHDCKDFRMAISSECEFPITKYLKYLIQQKKSKQDRIVEKNVAKLQGTWNWAATMNEFYEHGYSDIGITASNYNPLEYIGSMTNGRRITITLRKETVETEPLFDIWMMKGWLGRKLNKDGMVKLVESLIDLGVLSGNKNNSSN